MVEAVENISAVLAIAACAFALAVIVARLIADRVPAAAKFCRAVTKSCNHLTLAIAGTATAGSLYFSEVADYIPCRLCWFQRIAMYPIAVVALVGVIRRDPATRWYVLPLALIGGGISSYHVAIEQGWLADTESCALFGPSCADVWFESFGFITLAWMALAGFAAIVAVNSVSCLSTDEE